MKFLLNVGLGTKATTTLSADVARQIVVANDFLVTTWSVVQSDTEPTLVCEAMPMTTDRGIVLQHLYQIAEDLEQDCIAVYSPTTGKGVLIGPDAQAWGKFNPAYFFTLNGQRLAQEITPCQPSNA